LQKTSKEEEMSLKYQKNPTVVAVTPIWTTTAGNYGILGNLVSGDKVLVGYDGEQTTMNAANFALKYTVAADTATLTGNDYD
jgi:hypothetical protein